jgi:tRNA-binding protein
MSECLILGAVGESDVILLAPDFKIQNGLQLVSYIFSVNL